MPEERCPPHNFKAAWMTDEVGVLFCSACGEIRELAPQKVGPPVEESIKSITVTDKQP